MRGQLHALGFAARERGSGLSKADIAEADFVENGELVEDLGLACEEAQSLFHGEVKNFVDALALVLDLEDAGLVAGAAAFLAGQFNIGEELHLDGDGAITFADIAASAGDVEGEVSGGVAAALGFGLRGEELADGIEGLDVGHRVRARGASDGVLVDEDNVVEALDAFQLFVEVGWVGSFAFTQLVRNGAVEDIVNERGLARSRDAGDADEHVQRYLDIDALEVVAACAAQLEAFLSGFTAARGNGDGELSVELAAGDGVRVALDLFNGSGGEDAAAELACSRTEVEEIVGGADHVRVVLYDEDGVAEVAEVVEDADELGSVARVQADGWLIEDVERAYELRSERGGELDALRFSSGERGGEAVEREVVEADGIEEVQALLNLVQDASGDLFLHGRECERAEEAVGFGDGERCGIADVLVAVVPIFDADGAGFGPQALAFALGTESVAAILAEHDADVQLVLLAFQVGEEAMDAEESIAAVEDEGLLVGFEVVPGSVHGNAMLLCRLLQFGEVGAIFGAIPRVDGTFFERLRLVGDDEVEVEVDSVAEALATRAGAEGVVEGEEARFGLAVDTMAGLALEGCGEAQTFAFCDFRVAWDDFVEDFA